MSLLFSKPQQPKMPRAPEPVEDVATIKEDAEVSAQKRKKKLLRGGRRSTILSGITQSLKERLGK